ncbi:hypothetical protein CDAR_31761 [Caerostris darwini]|uniref:Shugoshin C-terminal domain-containing protein n=1 Tax=Caerostris darwini TaxID=1538125 RepID=A0AAV4NR64_9ARAC|nr:hypothetical protein CDAR_31761 [Caerostris darwini]
MQPKNLDSVDSPNKKEKVCKLSNKNIKVDVLCNYDSKPNEFDTLSSIENKCPVLADSTLKCKAKSSREHDASVALKVGIGKNSKSMQLPVEIDPLLLIQKKSNSDILSSATIDPENNDRRSRRKRATVSLKEPSLNTKMRR